MKIRKEIFYVIPVMLLALFLLINNENENADQPPLSLNREISEVGIYDSVFMVGMDVVPDFTMLTPDFVKFYDQFCSNELFQSKHVRFPLKGVCFSTCDSTLLWDSKDWQFLSWDFRSLMEDNRYRTKLAQSKNKVFFKCELKDLGILYEVGFLKTNYKWVLIYCVLNAC